MPASSVEGAPSSVSVLAKKTSVIDPIEVAPDLISARIAAVAQGSRVEVLSERTETSKMFVNEDLTWTTEHTEVPTRLEDKTSADGWRDISLELVEASDGVLTPEFPLVDLELSGGTSATPETPLVSAQHEDSTIGLDWEGVLPKPVIDGDKATYVDVAPDTDLVIQATRFGFEQFFVIKERPANPEAVELSLAISSDGLEMVDGKKSAKSGMTIENVDGDTVGSVSPAASWDAAGDPTTNPTDVVITDMTIQSENGDDTLLLEPDAEWLSDPSTSYPVTIDPFIEVWGNAPTSDTYVNSASPNQTNVGSSELLVGRFSSGAVYRSYVKFDVSMGHGDFYSGAYIVGATLRLWNFHSATCSPKTIAVARAANPFDYTTATWNNQPSVDYGSQYQTEASLADWCGNAGFVNFDVSYGARQEAAWDASHWAWSVWANESDAGGFKGFSSSEGAHPPVLQISWDERPNTPQPVLNTQNFNGTAYVDSPHPIASAVVSDPEGQAALVYFRITNAGGGVVGDCESGLVNNMTTAQCVIDESLPSDVQLWISARTESYYNGELSRWSAPAPFYTSFGPPPTPIINCPSYGNGSWTTTVPSSAISCSITTPGGTGAGLNAATRMRYSINDGPFISVDYSGNSAHTETIQIPAQAGTPSIDAQAFSITSKRSESASYAFGLGPDAVTTVDPGLKTTDNFSISAAVKAVEGSTITAKLRWRAANAGDTGWTYIVPTPTVTTDGSLARVDGFVWSTKALTAQGATAPLNTRVPVLLEAQICFEFSGGGTKCSNKGARPVSVLRVPHAFGGAFPTADAGPGRVGLWTGEFSLVATDAAVATPGGNLSVSRSHTTFSSLASGSLTSTNASDNAFGPGWVASFDSEGDSLYQVVDNTASDGTFSLIGADAVALSFRQPGFGRIAQKVGIYEASDDDAAMSGLKLNLEQSNEAEPLTKRLKLIEPDNTISVWKPVSSGGGYNWVPESVTQPGKVGKTTYLTNAIGQVTQILAPVPDVPCDFPGSNGTTCASGADSKALDCTTIVAGCRALSITYAAATTATASSDGDVTNQVKSIAYKAWNPASSSVQTVSVATYLYNGAKRLISVTDPRSDLSTSYTYGSTGEYAPLTSISTTGAAKFFFEYSTGTSTATDARLARVKRSAAVAGGTDSILSAFVYDISPVSPPSGLPNLSHAEVAKWEQASDPVSGYAVFAADHPASSTNPSTATTSAEQWRYASLQYANANGYTVNTASYGASSWQLTAVDFDAKGNEVRTLDSRAINAIKLRLAQNPGLSFDVNRYASISWYNIERALPVPGGGTVTVPAGSFLTDSWTPERNAVVGGTLRAARSHTHYTYAFDPGESAAPNGGINPASNQPYGLVTRTSVGVAGDGSVSAQPSAAGASADASNMSLTLYSYAPIDGPSPMTSEALVGSTSGWTLGTPTMTTIDMGDSPNITQKSAFDKYGAVVKAVQPDGAAESTILTVYYTASTNSQDSRCSNKPQWAGLVCVTKAAADPSNEDLPDSFISQYNAYLQPLEELETSGSGSSVSVRTTTSTYLVDGRIDTVKTSKTGDGANSATTVLKQRTLYSDSGLPVGTRALKSDDTTAGTNTSTLDLWGRTLTYTNSLGETTTTTYRAPGTDGAGQVAMVSDSQGTTTYTYNGADANGDQEYRGLVTKMTVPGVGSGQYAAAYDGTAALVRQNAPGSVTETRSYDIIGQLASQAYTGTSTANTSVAWLAWTRQYDLAGRVVDEWAPINGTISSGSNAPVHYVYDRAGRLTSAKDYTAGAGCVTRTYAFDVRGDRTSSTTNAAAGTAACGTATSVNRTWTYDNSARTRSSGYAYDLFGRTTSVPAVDTENSIAGAITIGYFDTDAPRSIAQGAGSSAVRNEFTLDPAGRRINESTYLGTSTTATTVSVRHYADMSDNPSWITATTGSSTSTTRYVPGLDSGLSATVTGTAVSLTLDNPHGDIVATVSVPTSGNATGISAFATFDDYGKPASGAVPSTGAASYGWLGSAERAHMSNGLILMGARLYNSVTGRFSSLDPVPGGNENAYNYPNDPVNSSDTSGLAEAWKTGGGGSAYGRGGGVPGSGGGGGVGGGSNSMAMASRAVSKATGANVTGFTRHGLNSVISRNGKGVSPRAYLDALKNGKVTKGEKNTSRYAGKSAVVIVNEDGKIITAWAKGRGNTRVKKK